MQSSSASIQSSTAPLLPSFATGQSDDVGIGGSPSQQIEKTIDAVADATGLSPKGRQALLQWASWAVYASALHLRDRHLSQQADWKVVLPIDSNAGEKNLHMRLFLFLLHAEESAEVATDACVAFYKHNLIADFQDAFEKLHENSPLFQASNAALPEKTWREWIGALPVKELPPHAVPFEVLPRWAREAALFATDMADKDCSGMQGLNGLDLRHLFAPGINLENCDLRGTNFGGAIMPDANWNHTQIQGTILPRLVRR